MMPLGLLAIGEQAQITEIRGHKTYNPVRRGIEKCGDGQCRMEDMGIRVGKLVEILNNEGSGPILIKVEESRIALGRGMAMRILVRRKEK